MQQQNKNRKTADDDGMRLAFTDFYGPLRNWDVKIGREVLAISISGGFLYDLAILDGLGWLPRITARRACVESFWE